MPRLPDPDLSVRGNRFLSHADACESCVLLESSCSNTPPAGEAELDCADSTPFCAPLNLRGGQRDGTSG
jgi:hypothetical protein